MNDFCFLITLQVSGSGTSQSVVEDVSQIPISAAATPPTSVAPTNTTPTPNMPPAPPDPRFSYMDISTAAVGSLAPHVTVNSQVCILFITAYLLSLSLCTCFHCHIMVNLNWFQLPLFQAHPQLKQFIRPAVERAVQEWIHPVVERSIKIALNTCEQIIKKVFKITL